VWEEGGVMMEAGLSAEDQEKLLEQKRKGFECIKRVQEHFLPYVQFNGEQYVPKRIEYQKKAIWINAAWWTFSEMVIQLLLEKNQEVNAAIQKKVPEGFFLAPIKPSHSMIVSGMAVIATGIGRNNVFKEVEMTWEKMGEEARKEVNKS
jgi:hypothetical protein